MITIHTIDDGRTPGFVRLPAGAITPKSGMLLKQEEGLLTTATCTDEPGYICVTERETACEEGDEITVTRISPDMTLVTETPEEFTCVSGDKVSIADDGLGISGTLGGACEIVTTDEERTTFRIVPVKAEVSGASEPSEPSGT